MKLASFDIFDTTLIRKCGRPENVFYILSKLLFTDDEALQTDFFMWRLNAEKRMRNKLNKRHITLDEIYSDFEHMGFSSISKQDAINSEMEIESLQLISNLEIKKIIIEKRNKGFTICFISDMYLSHSFLKKILIREGCATESDQIFVSNEYGVSKESGELYNRVRQSMGDITTWIHYGDNIISDFKQCKKRGIIPILIDTGYTTHELEIEKRYRDYSMSYELSTLIGFQRCSRLHLSIHNDDYENAADYIASAYIPYLKYIFELSSKKNIRRLYFLYRDSHILFLMSQVLTRHFPEIECRPLYCSRKSLFLPTLENITAESICHVIGGKKSLIGKTVNEILDFFHLTTNQVTVSFNTINSTEEQRILMNQILNHKEYIKQEQKKSNQLLDAYFEQEGIYDKTTKAIVDVGWYGSTRMMINNMLRKKGFSDIPFIYYCCRKDVLGKEFGLYYSFLPYSYLDGQRTLLVEAYYSLCDVPSTIGYSIESGKIVPVFNEKSSGGTERIVTRINVEVNQSILSFIGETRDYMNYSESEKIWGVSFCEKLLNNPQNIRYSTFAKLDNYTNDNHIIKKVTLKELYFYLRTGHFPSLCLHNNSIYYTYGIDADAMKKRMKRFIKWIRFK